MTKHLFVNQLRQETTVPPVIIRKIYNDIIQHELTGDVYDNTTNYIGEITLAAPTYKEWADKVHEVFPDLIINSLYYMLFQDSNVESIMSNWLLSKGVGDGVGITYDDAKDKKIISIPSFKNNTTIEYFNELPYFEKVTTLQAECFQSCSNLKEIDLSNITNLGRLTFTNDSKLTKVILGNISTITDLCFSGCTSLETVINSENITTIKDNGFYNCTSLESIDLSNCTNIYNSGFTGCTSLTNVDLSNIVSLGYDTFFRCTKLKLINSTLQNCTSMSQNVFRGTDIESISLPNCTSISYNVFQDCLSLTSVSMPKITNIPGSFCLRDTALTTVTFNQEDNEATIGQLAFNGCTSLTNIDLSNVISIDSNAFNHCESLNNIDLSNVISFGFNAFSFSNIAQTIQLDKCTLLNNGGIFAYSNIKKFIAPLLTSMSGVQMFQNCNSLTEVDLPLCTEIGNRAFNGCTSLQKVNIPLLTHVAYDTFNGCKLLNDLTISDNLEIVDHGAFNQCKLLTNSMINLSHLTTIGDGAFYGCSSLTSADLSNCTSIGKGAFDGCSGLQTITLNNNITELPESVFRVCGNISIDVSNITKFNRYCLSGCTLESITLNNNITELGQDALHGITVNSEVVIPASITVLGSNVFNGFRPKHIKFLSSVPATTNGNAFYNFAVQFGGKIRVPAGSLETYKNAIGWEKLKNNTNWEEY